MPEGDKRHPKLKDIPWPVPENIDPDAFLLLGDPTGRDRTVIGRWWLTGSAAFIGYAGRILINMSMRRPPFSTALHVTAAWTLGMGLFGEALHRYKEQYCSERDLQLFHYICLHPEDFPPPKRVLYRDFLAPWFPIR